MTGSEFLVVWSLFPLSAALACGVLYFLTRPKTQ